MHGETSIRVTNRFKLLVAALDALFKDKKDPEAKGIRDILLNPYSNASSTCRGIGAN